MYPTNLRLLIIGTACFIFGPLLGYLLVFFGFFRLVQPPPANDLQTTLQNMQRLPSDMMANLIPLAIGALIGGTGLFLIVLAFIRHFLAPQVPTPQAAICPPAQFIQPSPRPVTPQPSPIRPTATISLAHIIRPKRPAPPTPPISPLPPAPLIQDDTRYMPKG